MTEESHLSDFFTCSLADPRTTLRHFRWDSLTKSMPCHFDTYFGPKVTGNEVFCNFQKGRFLIYFLILLSLPLPSMIDESKVF